VGERSQKRGCANVGMTVALEQCLSLSSESELKNEVSNDTCLHKCASFLSVTKHATAVVLYTSGTSYMYKPHSWTSEHSCVKVSVRKSNLRLTSDTDHCTRLWISYLTLPDTFLPLSVSSLFIFPLTISVFQSHLWCTSQLSPWRTSI